jgi:putative ABC transport system permease protein
MRIARLNRGLSVQQAQAQMADIARQLELQFPSTNRNRSVSLMTLVQVAKQASADLPPTPKRMHQTLWFMFGAVGLVMLVACSNVSGLLLARGIARQKEFALRIALGSGRSRVIRQALTETVLLFVCGGAAGLVLALWSRSLLTKTMAEYLFGARVSFDAHVFIFSLMSSLIAGLAFGLAPAFQAVRVNLNGALKDSFQVLGGWRRNRAHGALVVGEMALALVLLIGFGLLIRSYLRVESVAPGFDPTNVITVSAAIDQDK